MDLPRPLKYLEASRGSMLITGSTQNGRDCRFKSSLTHVFQALALLEMAFRATKGIDTYGKVSLRRLGLKLQTSEETNGDEYIRLETNGDEYIRVGMVQETSTYECLEVRRRVHTSA